MRRQGAGRIVNVSSVLGLVPAPYIGPESDGTVVGAEIDLGYLAQGRDAASGFSGRSLVAGEGRLPSAGCRWNPELPEGAVDRDAYVVCVLEQLSAR
jgi:NAD(P)-dependent dehydrogenase (short-subunit alcohol dehydrogenase family)